MIRILILLLIAFICGSLGAALAGSSKKGCLIKIVLGYIGAMIGGWLSRKLGVPDMITFHGIPVIWSIIGAALFVAFLELISGGNDQKK
jgi:uncharacterized membrane protein YeaQ/YmgE (transglycosylase-associated protein family)